MKKLFLSCCLLICGLMAHSQSSKIPTHLVISEYDGESISILLSDKPKITFRPDNKYRLEVTTLNGSSFEFNTNRLNHISYTSKTDGTEINTIISDVIEQQGDHLCFSTNKPNTHISVIDIKGNIIMSETIDSGNYFFKLTNLLPGTYIAKINNTTIKFIKR